MAYKALGWAVWRVARIYLRRRYGGVVTKRRVLLAGGAIAVAAGLAVVGLRGSEE
ncbi:MAG: hypothetical protein QOF12_1904 [Solirubrobacteraceae bacterium]|jgi:hypothetical protein|nr:hypothetical protein [Solirubrobacteraceae bacterium]